METISKNKDQGYCILSYGRNDNIYWIIVKALEKAGFTVQRTSQYDGDIIRRILIVYWQEFPDTFKESQLKKFDKHRNKDELNDVPSENLENLENLKTLYQSIKIDKPIDPAIIENEKKSIENDKKLQEEWRQRALLQRQMLITNTIDRAMEIISKNKDKGYFPLSYDRSRYKDIINIIPKALEKAGFTVEILQQYERTYLIVYWQEFTDYFKKNILCSLDQDSIRRNTRQSPG
jgi:hypothetical protein